MKKFVTENMFSSNTLLEMRNTTTTTDVLYNTTKKDQSSISQSTVTTPLVSLTTSTFATKTSTTMIAITTTNSTPTLPATSVNPYYNKSKFPTISTINKTNSPQSFPKLSNSSSTSASNLSSTATTKTLPKLTSTSSVNLNYTNAQFPTISPIGNKNDSLISIPKSSSMSTSKLSSITTTNTPPKYLSTSVNPFKTKAQLPTILPFGNMTYSPQFFPRLSTSSPKFSFKLPSTKSFSISPIILSTSVHPTNSTAQFSTTSPTTKKTDSSQYFPKLSTSILGSDHKATSKQILTPTEATKPTAAQIVTSIVDPKLKSVKVDLNSSADVVHNFHRRRPSIQITTPNHSKRILFPLTSKPLVLPVPSLFGNGKQKVKFLDPPPIVRFKSPNKSITTTAKLGPRYTKTYTLGTTFTLLATTISPKSMRNVTVRAPKSKNDVLHPKWKDLIPVPPPLPPLEPKPEVVVPGSETTRRSQTASSSQNPTTMLTSFSVKGWQWKSKYRQRGETNNVLFTCVTSPHNILLLYS